MVASRDRYLAVRNIVIQVIVLLGKSDLLRDFKAVKTGNVWCTGKNLYQEMTQLGAVIGDIHTVLTEENPDPAALSFLYHVE